MTLYRWNSYEKRFTPTSVGLEMAPVDRVRELHIGKGQHTRPEVATGDLCIRVIEGAWRMQIANSQLTVRHDEAVIIPSGFSHSAEAIEDSRAIQMETDAEPGGNDSRWAV